MSNDLSNFQSLLTDKIKKKIDDEIKKINYCFDWNMISQRISVDKIKVSNLDCAEFLKKKNLWENLAKLSIDLLKDYEHYKQFTFQIPYEDEVYTRQLNILGYMYENGGWRSLKKPLLNDVQFNIFMYCIYMSKVNNMDGIEGIQQNEENELRLKKIDENEKKSIPQKDNSKADRLSDKIRKDKKNDLRPKAFSFFTLNNENNDYYLKQNKGKNDVFNKSTIVKEGVNKDTDNDDKSSSKCVNIFPNILNNNTKVDVISTNNTAIAGREPWTCTTCTFINKFCSDTCETCFKDKIAGTLSTIDRTYEDSKENKSAKEMEIIEICLNKNQETGNSKDSNWKINITTIKINCNEPPVCGPPSTSSANIISNETLKYSNGIVIKDCETTSGNSSKESSKEFWNCPYCTFINKLNNSSCEICLKLRTKE